METRKGNLSIESENIFPIIKKWVYSDHDIFVREMISNCCDAIVKLKKLDVIGEYELPKDYKPRIHVVVDPKEKSIKFIDNGLGMTADEVEEYITQIAFSGATRFLEKYKGKTTSDDMIGHFGLGFYSAFMVADEVHIDTLSYMKNEHPVHWSSSGGIEYEIGDGAKTDVGTEVTLFLNEDSVSFANEYKAREVLEKYCAFIPVEIFLSKAGAKEEYETIDEEDVLDSDTVVEHISEEPKKGEKGEPKKKAKIVKRPVPVNDTHPLWTKNPGDCTKEEYIEFYRKVFMDYREPLFWIHLKMDYPLNLKGILYFPKINIEYESIEGIIKLYNNQVFIADNIKEVIPQFLMLLKGVIDCPDLPLNVSRSSLQNDGFVQKVADYIAKKVAEKLIGMFKTDRASYEKYWDDISPFIKFGCLKDQKFAEKIKDFILYKDLDHKYFTLQEFIKEKAGKEDLGNDQSPKAPKQETTQQEAAQQESATKSQEKNEQEKKGEKEPAKQKKTTVFYVTDEKQQSQYINMFREQGQDAVILSDNIDAPFISYLEVKDDNLRFQRVDADVHEALKSEVTAEEKEDFTKKTVDLVEIFRKELKDDKLNVQVEKLKDEKVASLIILAEQSRRMEDMMRMYGPKRPDDSTLQSPVTLILNSQHPLVRFVLENRDNPNVPVICQQLYDLAMIAHRPLSPAKMTEFVQRSNKIMMLLTK